MMTTMVASAITAWFVLYSLAAILVIAAALLVWSVFPSLIRRATGRSSDGEGVPPPDDRAGSNHDLLRRSDLYVVMLFAGVVGAGHVWWIWQHRGFGSFDHDESTYLAGAFQFHKAMSFRPHPPFELWYGPLVPILSAVLTFIGRLDPRTVLSIQPLLGVALAVCSSGAAGRVTSRRPAIFVGLTVCLLPVTLAATQVYLLAAGATLSITAALWACLASDHGSNRRIWWVGPLLATAPMSRGMALVFLPAAGVGVLVACSTSRHGFRRAVGSLSLGAIGVSSFFLVFGRRIISYLTAGISTPAGNAPGLLSRMAYRGNEVAEGIGRPVMVVAVVVAGAGIVTALRSSSTRLGPVRGNAFLALAVTVFGGSASLLAGGFLGGYGFWDYPLIPPLVILLVALGSHAPRVIALAGAAWTALWVTYLTAVGFWILPPTSPFAASALGRYSMPPTQTQTAFDPRFTVDRRADHRRFAAEWWKATRTVESRLLAIRRSTGTSVEVVYFGGVRYDDYDSRLLAVLGEYDPIKFTEVSLVGNSDEDWQNVSHPSAVPGTRILLIPELGSALAGDSGSRDAEQLERAKQDPNYKAGRKVLALATSRGWIISERIPLAIGDEMLVVRAPSA